MTGGAGFIGGHLVRRLAASGIRVRVLDDFSTGSLRWLSEPAEGAVEVVRGDVRDETAVAGAIEGAESVVHLAAQTSVPLSLCEPAHTMDVNVQGTRNVLEACADAGVRKLVFASSCAVYGNPTAVPIREDAPLSPLSPYAESKALAERACARYAPRFSEGVTVLRYFNVYGPKDRGSGNSSVVDSFADRLLKGEPTVIYGDGRQTRDFVHVNDVCLAVERALAPGSGTFNVGTGVETSLVDLAVMMHEALGVPGVSVFAPPKEGEVRRSAADTEMARKVLGFEARVPLEDGLRTVVERAVTAA